MRRTILSQSMLIGLETYAAGLTPLLDDAIVDDLEAAGIAAPAVANGPDAEVHDFIMPSQVDNGSFGIPDYAARKAAGDEIASINLMARYGGGDRWLDPTDALYDPASNYGYRWEVLGAAIRFFDVGADSQGATSRVIITWVPATDIG